MITFNERLPRFTALYRGLMGEFEFVIVDLIDDWGRDAFSDLRTANRHRRLSQSVLGFVDIADVLQGLEGTSP